MSRSISALVHAFVAHRLAMLRARVDDGQSTAEYAMVMLGAAAVAVTLAAWASKTGKITDLLDGVVDSILDRLS